MAEVAAPGDEVGVGLDEGEGVGAGIGDVGHWKGGAECGAGRSWVGRA